MQNIKDYLSGTYLHAISQANQRENARLYLLHAYHLINQQCRTAKEQSINTLELFLNPSHLKNIPIARRPRELAIQRWQDNMGECSLHDDCPHHREQRQLILLGALVIGVGVLAIGSYLLSSAKLVDMSATITTGPNDETIEALQDHETRITINEADILRTKKAVNHLSIVAQTLSTYMEIMVAVQLADKYVNALVDEAMVIMAGLRSLSQLKFSPDLVPPPLLRRSIHKLRLRLDRQDIQILPNQGHEFYELETSFVYTDRDDLITFLHVPGFKRGSMLDLYEYVPTPIKVSENRYFLPNPPDTILVVDPTDTTVYRSMTRSDLALCKTSGSRYYCPGQNFYRKHVKENCLMDLFQNRVEDIAANCPFIPLKPDLDYLVQISPIDFIIYQPEEEQIMVTCGGPTGKSVPLSFSGVMKVTLPAGCSASSRSFNFDGEIDIFMQDDSLAPYFAKSANMSSLFPAGILNAEIDEVMAELGKVGSREGVKIKDLATILEQSRMKYKFEFSLGIVGTIVAIIVLTLVIFFCCIRSTGTDGRSLVHRMYRTMARQERRERRKKKRDDERKLDRSMELRNMANLNKIGQMSAMMTAAIPPHEDDLREEEDLLPAPSGTRAIGFQDPEAIEIAPGPGILRLHAGRTPRPGRRGNEGIHSPDK